MQLLIPSNKCDDLTLNINYQILIDNCIDLGKCQESRIKLISWCHEVTNFTLAEWIYIADCLKFRSIWIVPAWAKYTVRPKFGIVRWAPCGDRLSLYAITNKFLFNNNIKYWTSDRDDALNFLDFSREYDGLYRVFKIARRDSYSEWVVEECYRNYSSKDIIENAIWRSNL